MPGGTVPPYPWKLTVALFDEFESAVRSENLAAEREVLDKYRAAIDKGREESESQWKLTVALFDEFESAVRSEDLAAEREVLDKYRAAIDKGREELTD